jgi:AcrR family transcriptional regulator
MSSLPPDLSSVSASDAPVRVTGTRARAGNAMARTRGALLEAAGECLGRYGIRKTTMVDVASRSRVAKATLYNHFRTKDDLLAAYVEDRVASLVATASATASEHGLVAALRGVASALAADAPLRRAATEEPGLLAPLAVPGPGRGWVVAKQGAAAVLTAGGVDPSADAVEALLRWVTSQLLWPATDGGGAGLLQGGPAVELVDVAEPAPTVGWPG